MNASLKTLIGCSAAIATLCFVSLPPRDSHAAESGGAELYKVYNASPLINANHDSTYQLETELNALAKQGWKVRTSVGGYVIFVK